MAFPLSNLLATLSDKAGKNPVFMQRLLLVGIMWGTVSYMWGSIAENALTNRLPTLFSHATRSAAEVSSYLQRSADILTSLTDDPRLIVGLSSNEGTESTQVMRAMYEFSYLNKLSKIWVYSGRTDAISGLAGAGEVPDEVRQWLKGVPVNGNGMGLLLHAPTEGEFPYTYYITKPIPGSNGGLAVARLSAQALLQNWPTRPSIEGFNKAQQGLLGTGGNSNLWLPLGDISRAQEEKWFSPGRAPTDYQKDDQGNVWVWSAVPNQPGWRVAILTPLGNALGDGRSYQWLLLGGALLATGLLLWQPTRKVRKKAAAKVRQYSAPALAVGGKALAPAFKAAKGIQQAIRKETSGNAPLAELGDFDAQDFRRGKPGMRGSSAGGSPSSFSAKRMPSAPSLNPSVQSDPLNVQADNAPTVNQLLGEEATPENNTSSSLDQVVDQAIIQRRVKLLYQPIYSTQTGLPEYHEVLARLGDDQGNWMTPQVFIPVLQKHKWMPRLDALVFGHILAQYGDTEKPETPLSLNISGATVDNIRYLNKVKELKDIPVLHNLMFELSSKELLANPEVVKLLLSLKTAGVKLAVDYFGGGNTMLEASQKLGFDCVKINAMRFSADDAGKKDLIVLCRTAQRIKLPVVLEKIESMEMEVFARKLGVAFLQGYQLSRPLDNLTLAALPSWSANSNLPQNNEDNVPENGNS